MLISVIIPIYNCRTHLEQALASLLAQDCDDFEALLVDDCSNDGTREWLMQRATADARFKPVLLERNGGPARARNAGLRQAAGEFVAFLDSDDLWQPEKLSRQLELFRACPEVGLCATNGWNIDAAGGRLGPLYAAEKARDGRIPLADYLLDGLPIVTSSVMLRRALLDRVGLFKEDYQVAEDYELWLRLLQTTEIRFLEAPLTCYRIHGGSATASKLRNRLSKVRVLENEVLGNPDYQAQLTPAVWTDFQRKCCSLGKMLLKAGQKELGRSYLDKAIALNRSWPVTVKALLYKMMG